MRLLWDILLAVAYLAGTVVVMFVVALAALLKLSGDCSRAEERVSDQWEWNYMPPDLHELREKRLAKLNRRVRP